MASNNGMQRQRAGFIAGAGAGFFGCLGMLTATGWLRGPAWVAGLVLCVVACTTFTVLGLAGTG